MCISTYSVQVFHVFCILTNTCYLSSLTSLVAQKVKCLPSMQDTGVRSLGGADPLKKEMANHSNILAWKTPWMEKPGGLQSMESQKVGHD